MFNRVLTTILTTVALCSFSTSTVKPLISTHQNNSLQVAQFAVPTPPDSGLPSGHGQGGGAREQASNGFSMA